MQQKGATRKTGLELAGTCFPAQPALGNALTNVLWAPTMCQPRGGGRDVQDELLDHFQLTCQGRKGAPSRGRGVGAGVEAPNYERRECGFPQKVCGEWPHGRAPSEEAACCGDKVTLLSAHVGFEALLQHITALGSRASWHSRLTCDTGVATPP